MATLIAGNFQEQAEAQQAMQDLQGVGFAADQMTTFYFSPAGQHDLYPVGGDEDKSPGAEDAASGAVSGSAVGSVVGIAVGVVSAPLLGPAAAISGAGVGAYVGSLYGALGSMDSNKELSDNDPPRQSGMLVAVCAPTPAQQGVAIRIMRRCGAMSIDGVEGTIFGGEWIDFNPLTPMHDVIEQR